MISSRTLLAVIAESPQRAEGVRRLARALGVRWVGRTRRELVADVAQAAALDSLRGIVERARSRGAA